MLDFIFTPVKRLLGFLSGLFLTYVIGFRKGVKHEQDKNIKEENKRLKSNLGVSDSALAKRLRDRAKRKDKDNG